MGKQKENLLRCPNCGKRHDWLTQHGGAYHDPADICLTASGGTSRKRGVMPKRMQLKRSKGWRIKDHSDDYVIVDRRSKWGNPFQVTEDRTAQEAVIAFQAWLTAKGAMLEGDRRQWILEHIHELQGRDLFCWCKPGEACHADVLLKLANESEGR